MDTILKKIVFGNWESHLFDFVQVYVPFPFVVFLFSLESPDISFLRNCLKAGTGKKHDMDIWYFLDFL